MEHRMETKNKCLLLAVGLMCLASMASADYLQRIRDLDQRLICVVMWFAPAIIVLLFVAGAVLLVTGSPANRVIGKSLMMNAILGMFLVMAFLALSAMLMQSLDLAACYG